MVADKLFAFMLTYTELKTSYESGVDVWTLKRCTCHASYVTSAPHVCKVLQSKD